LKPRRAASPSSSVLYDGKAKGSTHERQEKSAGKTIGLDQYLGTFLKEKTKTSNDRN
jgi:hypothetical protein